MKLGIFSDPHYSSQEVTSKPPRYNNKSLGKIKKAYEYFINEKCDLVVCLGDLTDTEETHEEEISNLKKIADVIKSCPIPTFCLMGNHDANVLTVEDFYSNIGLKEPKYIEMNGRHLIFLDACFFHDGRHYAPGGTEWIDTFVPNEEELKKKLKEIEAPAYIFIHQNIDPAIGADERIVNSNNIFNIIKESGVVKAVFQGHCHSGKRSEYDGIKYITLPAMCEHEGAFYIFEI